MKKYLLGLAVAFALVGASSANAYTFNVNLTLGSAGADVVALQDMLIAGGHLVMPAGVSKGYFGALTQTAVAKWQAANGIAPAAGYFGPISRAKASGAVVVTPSNPSTPSTGLQGGDGDFSDYELSGQPSNEDVEEGESVEVVGFEFEAEDSDLLVERVDFELSGNGDEKPWKFFEEIKLNANGKEVASIDASDSDEWDETSTDDEYEATFTNVDTKTEEGDVVEYTIEVVADDSIDDSDLPITWTIAIADDGIRAVNAEGINVYEGSDADTETFTLEAAATGTLDIVAKSSDNEDQTIEVDEDNDTEDVLVYFATLEAEDGDNTIEEVVVNFASTTGTVGELDEMIKTAYLFIDGDEVGSESISASATGTVAITFDDIDFVVEEDEEVEMEVRVDINEQEGNYTDGDEFYVDSVSVDYVDSEDDDQVATDGANGGEMTLRVSGMTVEVSGTPSYTRVFTADDAGEKDRVEYTISFKVTAFGDEDVYIDKSVQNTAAPSASAAGIAWASTTDSTGTTTASSQVFSASGNTDDDTTDYFFVEEGSTRTFTLRVTLEAGQDGAAGVRLTGINYDTDSTIGTDYYTINLDDYKVDPVSVNII